MKHHRTRRSAIHSSLALQILTLTHPEQIWRNPNGIWGHVPLLKSKDRNQLLLRQGLTSATPDSVSSRATMVDVSSPKSQGLAQSPSYDNGSLRTNVQSGGPQAFPQEHDSLPSKENHPSEETARDNGADRLTLWLRCLPTSALLTSFCPFLFVAQPPSSSTPCCSLKSLNTSRRAV
jgi:hypothetical protein